MGKNLQVEKGHTLMENSEVGIGIYCNCLGAACLLLSFFVHRLELFSDLAKTKKTNQGIDYILAHVKT